MTREEMVDRMVADDIEDIRQAMFDGDYEFLSAVLSGDGWVPYNQLTDVQVIEEYNAREYEEAT